MLIENCMDLKSLISERVVSALEVVGGRISNSRSAVQGGLTICDQGFSCYHHDIGFKRCYHLSMNHLSMNHLSMNLKDKE